MQRKKIGMWICGIAAMSVGETVWADKHEFTNTTDGVVWSTFDTVAEGINYFRDTYGSKSGFKEDLCRDWSSSKIIDYFTTNIIGINRSSEYGYKIETNYNENLYFINQQDLNTQSTQSLTPSLKPRDFVGLTYTKNADITFSEPISAFGIVVVTYKNHPSNDVTHTAYNEFSSYPLGTGRIRLNNKNTKAIDNQGEPGYAESLNIDNNYYCTFLLCEAKNDNKLIKIKIELEDKKCENFLGSRVMLLQHSVKNDNFLGSRAIPSINVATLQFNNVNADEKKVLETPAIQTLLRGLDDGDIDEAVGELLAHDTDVPLNSIINTGDVWGDIGISPRMTTQNTQQNSHSAFTPVAWTQSPENFTFSDHINTNRIVSSVVGATEYEKSGIYNAREQKALGVIEGLHSSGLAGRFLAGYGRLLSKGPKIEATRDSAYVGVSLGFGMHEKKRFFATHTVLLRFDWNKHTRNLSVLSIQNKANYKSFSLTNSTTVGYRMPVNACFFIVPHVRFTFDMLSQDAYTETSTNASAVLKTEKFKRTSWSPQAGISFQKKIKSLTLSLTPFVTRQSTSQDRKKQHLVAGGASGNFTNHDVPQKAKIFGGLGLHVVAHLNNGWQFSGDVSARYYNKDSYGIKAQINIGKNMA